MLIFLDRCPVKTCYLWCSKAGHGSLKLKLCAARMQNQRSIVFLVSLRHMGYPEHLSRTMGHHFTVRNFVRRYMIAHGITHRKITPLWPQANVEAETLMKPLKKCLQTVVIDNKDWNQALQQFLLNYRAAPHCATKIPPATALFDRNIHTKLLRQEARVNEYEVDPKADKRRRC